jgi:hypothetical protein
MKNEVGNKNFPIWLLGDSNPKNWQDILITPLDSRHPARHSIWTPVLDVIQDNVFRKSRKRVDTSSIYIRNAIENPIDKPPEKQNNWSTNLDQVNEVFSQLLFQYQPVFVLCFGSFSFEFARRALKQEPNHPFGYWGARNLGIEFRQRISEFNLGRINALPLLHTSISRGRFIESHNYFTQQEGGNYFEFAGNQIANKLLLDCQQLNIWIE